jgi:ribonucleoside-diphosphate reductase alpha chain
MQKISHDVWYDKYRWGTEQNFEQTCERVIRGVYEKDTNEEAQAEALFLLKKRLIVPGGRIYAGAGTDKRVTLINCYVSPDIQDSMNTEPDLPGLGIMDSLKVAALTQQMGGGIGMDFSTIRPRGAIVKRTGSVSSGVLPFMDMWNAMCQTIKSSGSRRGAMMGTLGIWHPDIEEFITAKHDGNRLRNFNVSVLVTDAFMKAVENDEGWLLHFNVPHVNSNFGQPEDKYVYKTISARELWNKIIESTYIHAEPGIQFIDRINQQNNLSYCETIHCSNPCGEQTLPANGDCNLGHVNLAEMVNHPFTDKSEFNMSILCRAVACMVRFLDNVLDITQFPTEAQASEAKNKRRIGLGYTGLGNALQQLNIRYGSQQAIEFTSQIGEEIAISAYRASVDLARERGPFPLFEATKYCNAPFVKKIMDHTDLPIRRGIRNGVLLTIAPTGTTSVLLGNISSGIEPTFAWKYQRKVLQPDSSFAEYPVLDWGYEKYCSIYPSKELPNAFVTANELTVDEHLTMQAAAQEWIDASISKTINCPESMTLEEFREVYSKAYKLGLKGCTTYRPDPRSGRGAVLSVEGTSTATQTVAQTGTTKIPMQEIAEGRRYRIKWPGIDYAIYVMITDYIDENKVRRPFEVFIMSKSARHEEWIKALTLLITAIFRRGGDIIFIVEELKQVFSTTGSMWYKGKYVPSIVAMIGVRLEEHLRWLGLLPQEEKLVEAKTGIICDKCNAPAVVFKEGCRTCMNCGTTDCG